GTGIGLALSQKVVNEHGGTIKIHSVPGQGTEVIVTLPVWREKTRGGEKHNRSIPGN
ncbi:MAG TPA: HAMP domain-containing histidine kinase, partial [Desulfobulbus sp.]|nr:HAMP domain-containing histidine kinase [Desulfobulbus sp.]